MVLLNGTETLIEEEGKMVKDAIPAVPIDTECPVCKSKLLLNYTNKEPEGFKFLGLGGKEDAQRKLYKLFSLNLHRLGVTSSSKAAGASRYAFSLVLAGKEISKKDGDTIKKAVKEKILEQK